MGWVVRGRDGISSQGANVMFNSFSMRQLVPVDLREKQICRTIAAGFERAGWADGDVPS